MTAREGTPETVAGGSWLADELARTIARIDELSHELARVQEVVNSQQAESAQTQQQLAVVQGRTQRHEMGQDAARVLAQQSADQAERVEQEASLRRDLAAAVQRMEQREHDEQQSVRRELEQLASGLDRLQGRLASDDELRRRITTDIAEQAHQEETLDGRVKAIEHRAGAADETSRKEREELARITSALAGLLAAVDELSQRAQSAQEERRRLEGDLASLRADREREAELLEVIEQQRAARQRAEERLTAFDRALEEARRELDTAAEERSMLRQQTAGNQQRLRELTETLEGQRLALIEHFRRWTESGAESGGRTIAEIERGNRVARDLLVRLTERTDEAGQEQPL